MSHLNTLIICSILLFVVGTEEDYRIAIGCAPERLNIVCEEGKHIKLISANYGRTSLSYCSEHGHLNSVTCSTDLSGIVNISCSFKKHCTVLVGSGPVFGDPCFGTTKYLEVKYQCISKLTMPTSVPSKEYLHMGTLIITISLIILFTAPLIVYIIFLHKRLRFIRRKSITTSGGLDVTALEPLSQKTLRQF